MSRQLIRFSVIMPTYNQCSFIRRAIISLMQQTYKECELIIINDGCTDETEEYIADYLEDPCVTYIINKENTGLGYALNQGLDVAKYDYIAYLPSDDYYYENHLETIKEEFEEDGDLPSERYFTEDFSPKLSDGDGEIHTVVFSCRVRITNKSNLC